ncbi:MAG TPA: hypothetical protein VHK88_13955, partial [Aquihabitans sp.]|nr:hypothetical protein [Aquihabitans sp.]
AARLWGLVERSGPVQLLAGDDRRVRLDGVRVRRTALLPDLDTTTIGALPVATLSRTVVDLAAGQSPETIETWIDEGLRSGRLHLLELQSCLARSAGPGRARSTALEASLARRGVGDEHGDSVLEARAVRALRAAGLPAPVLQHPVRRPDGRTALLDLAYPPELVGIELDGWAHHGHRRAFDEDRVRTNQLTLLGWRMFHFTSTTADEVLVDTVRRALAAAAA